MNNAQRLLSVVIVIVGVALAALAVVLMAAFLRPWEPVLFWLGVSLLAGIVLIVVLSSFDTLEPDVMIALTFFGDVIRVYSPLDGGDRGLWGSGLVLVFPPGLVQAHRLPTEAWDIRYRAVGGFTKNEPDEPSVPCAVELKLTFQLAHDKKGITKMLQAFPLLDEYDLTQPSVMKYETQDPKTLQTIEAEYSPPCIAQKIAEVTQGVLDEAISRVLGKHKWSEARSNQARLETDLKKELGENTIFAKAEMLDGNGNEGLALTLFDPNIALIRPLSDEAFQATSAEFQEQHLADAARARGKGLGDELKEIAERGGVTGREALAGRTAEKIPNITVVSADGLIEGGLGRLLSGKKPSDSGGS